MNQKLYLGAAVFCLIGGMWIIHDIDQSQPNGVNVPLTNNLMTILTMAMTFFFGQLANSAKIEKKGEELKQTVQGSPAQVLQAADVAKDKIADAADKAAEKVAVAAQVAVSKLDTRG